MDQICFQFFNEILIGHFQPLILKEFQAENISTVRTAY